MTVLKLIPKDLAEKIDQHINDVWIPLEGWYYSGSTARIAAKECLANQHGYTYLKRVVGKDYEPLEIE